MAGTDRCSWAVRRATIVSSPSLSTYALSSLHITEAILRTGTLPWTSRKLAIFSHMSTTWLLAALAFVIDAFAISGTLTLATAACVARIADADAIFFVAVDAGVVTCRTHPAWIAACTFWGHSVSCVTVSTAKAVWNAGTVREVTSNTHPA